MTHWFECGAKGKEGVDIMKRYTGVTREGGRGVVCTLYNNIEIRHLLSDTVAHELGTGMQRATI